MEKPKRILVHVCCGVDAVYFLKRLREDYPESEIVAFFYDPNIHPYEEYLLRLKESERAAKMLGITFLEGEYDPESWLDSVKGLENEPEKGARCVVCFDQRLERSVLKAKELGCDAFTTTLLMSPKKSQQQLKKVSLRLAERHGLRYLHLDYRKGGGVQEMNRLVREKGIWRQDYCGCVFALLRQKGERAFLDTVSFLYRAPGTKAEHLLIREARVAAEVLNLPAVEDEFHLLGWYPLRGYLKAVKENLVVPSLIKPFSAPLRGRVRADLLKKVGNRLLYSKQGLTVELVDRLEGRPLETPFPSDPTFLVEKRYEKLLTSGRVEALLEVRVEYAKSRNLLIGDPESAKVVWTIAADSPPGGAGVSPEELTKFLRAKREAVLKGEEAVAVLGAEGYRAGSRRLKELLPRIEEKLKKAPLKGNF
ncbi:MAG: epoxyqueuosine reductase QueH [Aquificae bacterium]|nr:epoxyqueuosine reductase QueH [Aquificota bacterium]